MDLPVRCFSPSGCVRTADVKVSPAVKKITVLYLSVTGISKNSLGTLYRGLVYFKTNSAELEQVKCQPHV